MTDSLSSTTILNGPNRMRKTDTNCRGTPGQEAEGLREKTVFCASPSPNPEDRDAKRGKGAPPHRIGWAETNCITLDVVNLDVLATCGTTGVAIAITVLIELEAAVAVLVRAEGVGLVDLGCVGKLAVGLQGSRLVGRVL
jgi:hypothetical protein